MSFLLKLTKKISHSTASTNNTSTDSLEEAKIKHTRSDPGYSPTDIAIMKSKANVASTYNRSDEYRLATAAPSAISSSDEKRLAQFEQVIDIDPILDLSKLKTLAWQGIPMKYRAPAWKLILGYMPANRENREATLIRKRQEYNGLVKIYFENREENSNDDYYENKVMKTISSDVPRTQPDYTLFRHEGLQNMMTRILFIWAVRHPASGYVQGMNDLITPLIATFLNNYSPINFTTFAMTETLKTELTPDVISQVEADTYWCFSKIMDHITDNYTSSHIGVNKCLNKMKDITRKLDSELTSHFEKHGVEFFQFAFRWVYCLLVREFPLKLAIRLFDTYISDDRGFTVLHSYICIAIILKWSKKLKKMRFNDLILFLQRIPTNEWVDQDIDMLIAEAYVFRTLYEDSCGHLADGKSCSPKK
jgi:hypothetical protein